MNSTTTPQAEALPRTKHNATNRQIRGSSLLLAGRLFSKFVNLIIQVLTVRALSEADYGAFAYALSLVALGETIATIGLDRAITRFVPIYHEKRDYDKLFGTVIMVVGTVLAIGAAMILLVFGFQGVIGQSLIKDQQAVALLLNRDNINSVRNGLYTASGTVLTRTTNFQEPLTSTGPRIIQLAAKITF